MKVGITILKLSPNAKASKRKGNLSAVSAEAGPERAGSDPDIDRERSGENEYTGFKTSGIGLAYEFEKEAAEYSERLRAGGERGLRSDAIIGFSAIVKPPAEWVNGLSVEERKRFFADSDEIMYDLMGHDDAGRPNIRATALHRDELGEHKHYLGMPYTADGRLCAKQLINLQLFRRFNREYPERMRQKGWDIEDCVVYDADATKNMTQEELEDYKTENIKRKKQNRSGRNSKDYKAGKEKEAQERLQQLQSEAEAVEARMRASEAASASARGEAEEAAKAAAEARKTAAKATALYNTMFAVLQAYPEAFDELISRVGDGRDVGGLQAELQAAAAQAKRKAAPPTREPVPAKKSVPKPKPAEPATRRHFDAGNMTDADFASLVQEKLAAMRQKKQEQDELEL